VLQERPSCSQRSKASCLCCAVNRRLVLVGSIVDGPSGGHGMTLTDLSSDLGEAHSKAIRTGSAWVAFVSTFRDW
jgi:hypothetical protein